MDKTYRATLAHQRVSGYLARLFLQGLSVRHGTQRLVGFLQWTEIFQREQPVIARVIEQGILPETALNRQAVADPRGSRRRRQPKLPVSPPG